MANKKRILLGVTGSIAAYKAVDLVRALMKKNFDVEVILTENARAFIPALPLQVISKKIVHTSVLDEPKAEKVNHIELAQTCDLFLVAPASANILGKFAGGIADDLLSTIALAVPESTPKVIAPAMNTQMYQNRIVQRNIATLKEMDWVELVPREAMLACGDVGRGALMEIDTIVQNVLEIFRKYE